MVFGVFRCFEQDVEVSQDCQEEPVAISEISSSGHCRLQCLLDSLLSHSRLGL